MENALFSMPVRLDTRTFGRFALFDTLYRQRRWRAPALFSVILSLSGGLCLALQGRDRGAALLGAVLLAVGLGLPAVYFFSFFLSVRAQADKLGLNRPHVVYTLMLGPDGVEVSTGQERADYAWEQLDSAWRVEGCIYLYATPRRAYLLPDGREAGEADALWTLMCERLPPQRAVDRRR